MSELTDAAEAMAAAEDNTPTMAEAQELAATGQAEGITSDEVAQILGKAGMDITPSAPPATDEPDEDAADEPAPDDAPAADEQAATPDDAPEAKPADAPAADAPTDAPTDEPAAAKDYSFEAEDAEGQTYKIEAGDSLDKVLADFTPKNTGQLMDIVKQQMRLEDQKAADDADAQANAEAEERNAQVKAIQDGWDNEFKDLKVTDTARQDAIFAYMNEENVKREAANRPLITSVEDAKNGLEIREAAKAAEDAAKAAKEAKRANGALVGGSSAPASSGTPAYVSGQARNAQEAIRQLGLA